MNRRELLEMFGGAAGFAAIPKIKSVERLEIQSDDVLVLTCNGYLSKNAIANIRAAFERAMPGRKMMILEGGMSLKVIASQ